MPRIFISYRRDDSRAITGRIYDRLVESFGKDKIFKDVDRIPPGSSFAEILETELRKCNVLLVVIGRLWVNISDKEGNRRLDKSDDFVRIEVERGLSRPDLLVIPVMVDDVAVPSPAELPDTLDKLASLQVVQIRHDPDFHRDMNRLVDFLKVLDHQQVNVRQRTQRRTLSLVAIAITLLAFITIALIATNVISLPRTATPTFDPFYAANQLLTLTREAEVAALATPTSNYTATIEAILTSFAVQTHVAGTVTADAFTDTPTTTLTPSNTVTITLTPHPTDTPAPTITSTSNFTATLYAIETVNAQSTSDRVATVNAQATNYALATANAPTNTPQPTETYTPTSTFTLTPSYTPTSEPTQISTTNQPTATFNPTLITYTPSPIGQESTAAAQALIDAQAILNQTATASSWTATPLSSVYITINSASANLRQGPGTAYRLIGSAQKGDKFPIIAQNGNKNNLWYLVEYKNGIPAWISAGLVLLIPENSAISIAVTIPAPVVTAVPTTSVCTGRFSVGATVATRTITSQGNRYPLMIDLSIGLAGGPDQASTNPNFAGWVGGSTFVTILECGFTNQIYYKIRTPDGVVGWIYDGDLYK